MKYQKIVAMLFAIGLSFNSAFAQIQTLSEQPIAPNASCVIPKVDGERVPFPLRAANTKFELSQDETYLLNGTLIAMSGKVYFKVDFNAQPWLATEKLLQFPYFPVDSMTVADIVPYANRMVQAAIVTKKNDVVVPSGSEGQVANLKFSMILPPVAL